MCTDRQELIQKLKIEGLVEGRVAPDFSVALRQEFPPRGKDLGYGEIAQS